MSGVRPKLIAVVGPTASGKTDLAVRLAKAFGGEVISADSRQFYRGMEIGSDTVTGTARTVGGFRTVVHDGIPHHLVSFRSPKRPVTVAEFARMARRRIRSVLKRGRVPFLVGGSGLYVKAVVDNLAIPEVKADPKVRATLERRSTGALFAELRRKDPQYADRIAPKNRRYAIRALEVIAATGKPFSVLQRAQEAEYDVLELGIARSREEMYARIDARVDALMRKGLLEEAERLSKRYGWDLPSMSGLGHRQLGAYLRGETALEEAVRLVKRDTRHFAKRQMTWFRRDGRIIWVKTYAEAKRRVSAFLKGKKG